MALSLLHLYTAHLHQHKEILSEKLAQGENREIQGSFRHNDDVASIGEEDKIKSQRNE